MAEELVKSGKIGGVSLGGGEADFAAESKTSFARGGFVGDFCGFALGGVRGTSIFGRSGDFGDFDATSGAAFVRCGRFDGLEMGAVFLESFDLGLLGIVEEVDGDLRALTGAQEIEEGRRLATRATRAAVEFASRRSMSRGSYGTTETRAHKLASNQIGGACADGLERRNSCRGEELR
jgi:hypothetical protein